MQKLNPEVKEKWVTALRSGDYRQGTLRLRWKGTAATSDTFCCLGVLSDLYRKETGRGHWVPGGVDGYIFKDGYQMDTSGPTTGVCHWAGINPDDTDNDSVIGHLMGMNDHHRNNFNEIADWIEENL